MDFAERICGQYHAFLSENHFREISYVIDEKFFGNAILTFEGRDFDIRFVKDRGQLQIELSAKTARDAWYYFDFVLELLGYTWAYLAGLDDSEVQEILNKECARVADLLQESNLAETERRHSELALRPLPQVN